MCGIYLSGDPLISRTQWVIQHEFWLQGWTVSIVNSWAAVGLTSEGTRTQVVDIIHKTNTTVTFQGLLIDSRMLSSPNLTFTFTPTTRQMSEQSHLFTLCLFRTPAPSCQMVVVYMAILLISRRHTLFLEFFISQVSGSKLQSAVKLATSVWEYMIKTCWKMESLDICFYGSLEGFSMLSQALRAVVSLSSVCWHNL